MKKPRHDLIGTVRLPAARSVASTCSMIYYAPSAISTIQFRSLDICGDAAGTGTVNRRRIP